MTFPEQTGFADPANPLVPFRGVRDDTFRALCGACRQHVEGWARAIIRPRACDQPTYLCFMADCDGDADELLARIARKSRRAATNLQLLRRLWSKPATCSAGCARIASGPLASYVNWVGRTVVQVKEEAQLHRRLREALPRHQRARPSGRFSPELRQSARPVRPLTPETANAARLAHPRPGAHATTFLFGRGYLHRIVSQSLQSSCSPLAECCLSSRCAGMNKPTRSYRSPTIQESHSAS